MAQLKVKRGPSPLAAYYAKNFSQFWKTRIAVAFMKATTEAVLQRTATIRNDTKSKFSLQELYSHSVLPETPIFA